MSVARVPHAPEEPLLAIDGLTVAFRRDNIERPVVHDLSFSLRSGRCLAIVGESGSGKSVTARALVGLAGRHAQVKARRHAFLGRDISGINDREWRKIRGKSIGFVLQDALVSLDPLRPVGKEIGEGPRLHGVAGASAELADRIISLLRLVGVPEPEIKARQLPHELSGGQRQRALIAAALALDPQILIADEPTTALDVTVQAQILDLLEETRVRGKALVLISHDLAVVSRMADEVLVMRHGQVVERGAAEQIFRDPQHEYTRRLLDAVPSVRSRGMRLAPSQARRFAIEPAGGLDKQKSPEASGPLLTATGLVKSFRGPDNISRMAVRDVSFTLNRGETLGIVGESGSGKSTVARLVLALDAPDRGRVLLEGQAWSAASEDARRSRRKLISVVYQDPLSSFDPRWTVDRIVEDSVSQEYDSIATRRQRVGELLDLVSLEQRFHRRRPIELSGGQRQRVAIARAIAPNPKIIICDEPVSALDVSIQAQILDLLGDLKAQLGVSYLFISHDLGVVHHLSDRVLVMKEGQIVESGASDDVLISPQHDYTKRLVAAVPRLSARHGGESH